MNPWFHFFAYIVIVLMVVVLGNNSNPETTPIRRFKLALAMATIIFISFSCVFWLVYALYYYDCRLIDIDRLIASRSIM